MAVLNWKNMRRAAIPDDCLPSNLQRMELQFQSQAHSPVPARLNHPRLLSRVTWTVTGSGACGR
ncbi:hypothetical protein MUK42_37262 [Musa troglodytarum]|uniref:Uncharacterized protein n=1 Tax=Musa troglodytarum TaxID=320322 RepID=A0A9E7EFI4_9LILI|nr:hypothetical protein MUK42_37262 [Musa troglodytarum]